MIPRRFIAQYKIFPVTRSFLFPPLDTPCQYTHIGRKKDAIGNTAIVLFLLRSAQSPLDRIRRKRSDEEATNYYQSLRYVINRTRWEKRAREREKRNEGQKKRSMVRQDARESGEEIEKWNFSPLCARGWCSAILSCGENERENASADDEPIRARVPRTAK